MNINIITEYRDKIVANCGKVILGKDDVIEKTLISFLCGGHVLLEDLPGTGKTMFLRSFSKSVGGEFRRIQFTPDLMPSDLTGIHFYNQKESEFEFRPGPLFANVVLADEINRATPRTQSSLLEAMEEHQITVDGTTFALEEPFFVMATQNPLESYGTFPLPEAQMDRFFMRLSMGYMEREQEKEVLRRGTTIDIIEGLCQVVTKEETEEVKKQITEIRVAPEIEDYLMDIISATRKAGAFSNGASARGAIALYRAAQVKAAFEGREYVIPEDVKELTVPVPAHRLGGGALRDSVEQRLKKLLDEVRVPLENV